MTIYQTLDQLITKPRTIVLGNFDGVHLGHQALIDLARKSAQDFGQELMVFTFFPQLQAVFQPDFKYLLSREKKFALFEQCGVDVVLALPFNQDFAKTSPTAFVEDLLIKQLGAKQIVVGFNYHFGYQAAGDVTLLMALGKQHKVKVQVMPPFYLNEQLVNSSTIRQLVAQGDFTQANSLLGYPFSLRGKVVHGRKLGRTIGVPTANMSIDQALLLPAFGVYAVRVLVGGVSKLGVLNIGSRPTVNNGVDTSVEVHILDFNADIYGQVIEVALHHYLREEIKFNGLEELKKQIAIDMDQTRLLLENDGSYYLKGKTNEENDQADGSAMHGLSI